MNQPELAVGGRKLDQNVIAATLLTDKSMVDSPEKPRDLHGDGVSEAIRWLFRAIRTLRTYPEDNEISRRALAELLPRLSAVLPLSLEMAGGQLVSEGTTLHDDQGKTPQLVTELYRDGVRWVRLDAGLDEAELRKLLTVLATPLDPDNVIEDYVTRLWEAQLAHVRVSAIDPYLQPDITGDVLEGKEQPTELAHDVEEDQDPQLDVPPVPDAAFRIEKDEETRISEEVERLAATKRWDEFASAIFDALDSNPVEQTRTELTAIVEAYFSYVVRELQLGTAARLVEAMKRRSSEPAATAFEAAVGRMAQADRLASLHEALEAGTSNAQEVLSVLVLLAPFSLGAVCGFLDRAHAERARRVYIDVLSRIGNAAVETVIQRFRRSSGEIRALYARALAGLQGDGVVAALIEALPESNPAVEREVLRALSRQDDGRAVAALLRVSIEARDPASRIIALRGVVNTPRGLDSESLVQRIQSRHYGALSSEEKDLLFRALGVLGGDRTVPLLRDIIRPRWIPWLERRDDWSRAAAALAHIGTPAARDALQAFSQHRRSDLAAICVNALRKGK